MLIEESVHFQIHGEEAHSEWLWNSPYGRGTIRLGPKDRAFFVAMFHELHCLRTFRHAIDDKKAPRDLYHLQHCFNYLRQTIMCGADLTLEDGDFTKTNWTMSRAGATHICKDWNVIYEKLKVDWVKWFRLMYEDDELSEYNCCFVK